MQRIRYGRVTGTLLLCIACLPLWAQPSAEAKHWLERMLEATKRLNYEGTFIYVQGPHIEAMRIVHGRDEHGERQRLFSLSGAPREVLVTNGKVICQLPRHHASFASSAHQTSPFPLAMSSDLGRLESSYQLEMLGADRVAGLETRILAIQPRDHWRFGYRLWLEREHALLLRSVLLDERGRPLEQLMFTDLQVKPQLDAGAFQASTIPATPPAVTLSAPSTEAVTISAWRVGALPAGFVKVTHTRRSEAAPQPANEHIVFADGLATISVFLEKLGAGQAALLEGAAQLGSMHAVGRALAGHQILVVGEVPAATVQRIAAAIEYAPEQGK